MPICVCLGIRNRMHISLKGMLQPICNHSRRLLLLTGL